MPHVNIEAMNEHLAEISARVSVRAITLVILDGAGWHMSPNLTLPDNIVLLPLPPSAPELNPVENIWAFLRANFLSHRVFDDYDAVLKACAEAASHRGEFLKHVNHPVQFLYFGQWLRCAFRTRIAVSDAQTERWRTASVWAANCG